MTNFEICLPKYHFNAYKASGFNSFNVTFNCSLHTLTMVVSDVESSINTFYQQITAITMSHKFTPMVSATQYSNGTVSWNFPNAYDNILLKNFLTAFSTSPVLGDKCTALCRELHGCTFKAETEAQVVQQWCVLSWTESKDLSHLINTSGHKQTDWIEI